MWPRRVLYWGAKMKKMKILPVQTLHTHKFCLLNVLNAIKRNALLKQGYFVSSMTRGFHHCQILFAFSPASFLQSSSTSSASTALLFYFCNLVLNCLDDFILSQSKSKFTAPSTIEGISLIKASIKSSSNSGNWK